MCRVLASCPVPAGTPEVRLGRMWDSPNDFGVGRDQYDFYDHNKDTIVYSLIHCF